MRIDLGRLSTDQLTFELPPAHADAPARQLRVELIEALAGLLSTASDGFRIERLACDRALLEALVWTFGKLTLDSAARAELAGLSGEIAQHAGELTLALELKELTASRLALRIGQLELSARVEAHGLTLEVSEAVGLLRAQRAEFSGFELRSGKLCAALPALSVSELVVDWGGDEFRLEAGTADAAELKGELRSATLLGQRISIAALRMLGSHVSVGQVRVGQLKLDARFEQGGSRAAARGESRASPEALASTPKTALVDLQLLDGLAGRICADVAVDLAVPIIGRRRATHELRLGVEAGSIDFRELEHGLSRLEDSLLDFSVRDVGLVLERGLPLIATRGRGKPILIWELNAADQQLAERGRVRLAVLPEFRQAGRSESEPEEPNDEGGSAFRLRELSVLGIDVMLTSLQSPMARHGALRALTFADLTVAGELHHDAERAADPGRLHVGAHALRATLEALPIGSSKLQGRLEIGGLRDAEVGFAGTSPRSVKAVLEDVAVADFALT